MPAAHVPTWPAFLLKLLNITFKSFFCCYCCFWPGIQVGEKNPQCTIFIVSVLMISVPLRAHKLQAQVKNTVNTLLTHILLKTQWAVMRELKRVVLKFYILFIFHWFS